MLRDAIPLPWAGDPYRPSASWHPLPEREAGPALGARDAGAIDRARSGDQEAFAALYASRVGPVGRYIAAIIGDASRAEDALAQTFFLAWRDLSKLRRVDRFDAWLLRIAHNQALREVQRPRLVAIDTVPEPPEPAPEPTLGETLRARVDPPAMRVALLELSEQQRQVLVLRFLYALPHADVARELGVSTAAARALQHRALTRLRASLNRETEA